MNEIKKIIDTLDDAVEKFDGVVDKAQTKMYKELVALIKDLELDSAGKVKQTIANLKVLTSIKSKLGKIANSDEWVAGVENLIKYFGKLQNEQNAYFSANFPEATLGEQAKKRHEVMKQIAVQNTVNALTDDGLKAGVTDKINDILLRAVTSGEKFGNLQEELRAYLVGKDGGTGALSRYATTYATTSISQFTGQNNKLLTQDLGVEWFMYTGSTKETTREFCTHLVEKRYIHRSEFRKILLGEIDGHQCAIYPKTKLPYGMIEGTNEDNFQINCGGWNCRHQLVPVSEFAVPADVKAKIKGSVGIDTRTEKTVNTEASLTEMALKLMDQERRLIQLDDDNEYKELCTKARLTAINIYKRQSNGEPFIEIQNDLQHMLRLVNRKINTITNIRAIKTQYSEDVVKEQADIVGAHLYNPMSFAEADGGSTNPKYSPNDKAYKTNCQRCVVAFELRLRGLSIEADSRKFDGTQVDADGDRMDKIWEKVPLVIRDNRYYYDVSKFWKNSKTGKSPIGKSVWAEDYNEAQRKFGLATNENGRYVLEIYWNSGSGHVVNVIKTPQRRFIYDAQTGEIEKFSFYHSNCEKNVNALRVYRVDDCDVSDVFLRKSVIASKTTPTVETSTE